MVLGHRLDEELVSVRPATLCQGQWLASLPQCADTRHETRGALLANPAVGQQECMENHTSGVNLDEYTLSFCKPDVQFALTCMDHCSTSQLKPENVLQLVSAVPGCQAVATSRKNSPRIDWIEWQPLSLGSAFAQTQALTLQELSRNTPAENKTTAATCCPVPLTVTHRISFHFCSTISSREHDVT